MKKRLFALCAMGMVLLSACGSTSTAPTGGATEAVPQSVATDNAAASTGESAVSYDSEPMAMMTESAAAEAPRAAASKMDTSGAGQPGSGTIQQQSMAGVLTAAEYSDLDNWDFFQELVQDQKISFPSYGLDPTNAVSVTVTDNNQQPLAGESVILQDVQGAVLWETITDAEGKAWLFYGANTTPDTISVNGEVQCSA